MAGKIPELEKHINPQIEEASQFLQRIKKKKIS